MVTFENGPLLIVEGGPENNAIIHLGRITTLGRQAGNDVVIVDPCVSRYHAVIMRVGDKCYIRDLTSTNGSYVNGERVHNADRHLNNGDRITLGTSKGAFIYHEPATASFDVVSDRRNQQDVKEAWTLINPVVTAGHHDTPQPSSMPPSIVPGKTKEDPSPEVKDNAVNKKSGEEVYEGTVRLNIQAGGDMGAVINFVQRIGGMAELRLLRISTNQLGGVDVWVGLRGPVALQKVFESIEGVDKVSPPGGRDLSPSSKDPPLTIFLSVSDLEPGRLVPPEKR